jgi:nucleoside-diphosphate-sugar epimerase
MTDILITGAAGMLGRQLAGQLAADHTSGARPITSLTLIDVVQPSPPPELADRATCHAADLSDPAAVARAVAGRPGLIFHLAAIVSGEAEADLDKGYRINLDGTRLLLDAIRLQRDPWRPRFVFASSIAVFGGHLPATVPEDFRLTPQTSYGAQKAMGELFVADYTRKGIIDGIGIRLPTLVVRPGKPNLAASGFFSGIIREPLAGQEAILPVEDSVRHWMTSPRSAVGFLTHAADLDTARLGELPNLSMPGLAVTVGEEIEALRRAAGEKAVALIRRQPDDRVRRIVDGWVQALDATRAQSLGFTAETDFDAIVAAHIEDQRQALHADASVR